MVPVVCSQCKGKKEYVINSEERLTTTRNKKHLAVPLSTSVPSLFILTVLYKLDMTKGIIEQPAFSFVKKKNFVVT